MSDDDYMPRPLASLRTTLLALLPKDGTPIRLPALSRVASAPAELVIEAMHDALVQGQATYDISTDSYAAQRQ